MESHLGEAGVALRFTGVLNRVQMSKLPTNFTKAFSFRAVELRQVGEELPELIKSISQEHNSERVGRLNVGVTVLPFKELEKVWLQIG